MLGHRILAAAAVVLGLTMTADKAQAAPVLLLPDVNFVTHGDTFTFGGDSVFNLSVNTAAGDFMSIDTGTGFSAITGTLVADGASGLTMNLGGELQMHAVLEQVHLVNSITGKDLLAIYRIDSSSIEGYRVGQKVALDGLIFNIDGNAGQIKGDVAPIVPEPATLSLVLLGLGGLAGAARRKLS